MNDSATTSSAKQVAQTSLLRRLYTRLDWRQYVIYIVFVVIFIYFGVTLHSVGFLDSTNLLNIIRQSAMISIMACAMTFVIGAGEFDLSVGSVAGLSSLTTAMAIQHYGVAAGICAGLATGLIVGTINGALVTLISIPSLLVTLGMLGIAHGTAMWINHEAPAPILNNGYLNFFGGGDLGPIPSLVIWVVVAMTVAGFVLRKTTYGRKVMMTGGNRVAADFSGVNTKLIKFLVLLVSGIVAAIAGMLYAGYLSSGRFDWGAGDELSVIAAVILGGASLSGGSGSVIGAVFGSLVVGLINNGLILAGLGVSQQQVVLGCVIVFAVALGRRS